MSKPLYETELRDVCIVVRLKTDHYGLQLYKSVDEFVKANESAIAQIQRYVEGVDCAQVCSDINGVLPPLEKWNWKEWHKPQEVQP
jgi:hypothetical protein